MAKALVEVDSVVQRGGEHFPIRGYYAAEEEAALEAFMAAFTDDEETGAAVSVTRDGETVIDLWGGYADPTREREWGRETTVCMMSVAKGFAVTCLHMLADRGLVDYDEPASTYWPAFAQAGKQNVPVRYLLDHRAGLPAIQPAWPDLSIYDFDAMSAALARARPLWDPGARAGYHVLTLGFLVGELVRQVDGRTIGAFLRDEIAQPLGIDYAIGLAGDAPVPAEYQRVIAGTIFDESIAPPDTLNTRAWDQMPKTETFNSAEWRAAEIPGANGHGSAHGVARFYGALARGGEIDGIRLLSPDSLARATTLQWSETDVVLGRPYRMSLGYLLNNDFIYMGPNPRAFGHHGVGGSIGFADPDARVGFCYATAKAHARFDNGPRAGRIVRAVLGK
jgi:CubicO group peptidase (beta-lactamase class C family)